jgi:hypothetical protein
MIDLAMIVVAKDSEAKEKCGLELFPSNSANRFLGKRGRTFVARIGSLTPFRETLLVIYDRFIREK